MPTFRPHLYGQVPKPVVICIVKRNFHEILKSAQTSPHVYGKCENPVLKCMLKCQLPVLKCMVKCQRGAQLHDRAERGAQLHDQVPTVVLI